MNKYLLENTLHRQVFTKCSIPQIITTANLELVDMNESFCSFLGYSKCDIFMEFKKQLDLKMLKKRLLEQKEIDIERSFIHYSGALIFGKIRGFLFNVEPTNDAYLFLEIQDITKDKQKEKVFHDMLIEKEAHLNEYKELHSSLVETLPDGIVVHDEEQFLFVNPASVKLLGAKSYEDLVGQSIYKAFPVEDFNRVKKDVQDILKGENIPRSFQVPRFRLDGTSFNADITTIKTVYNQKDAVLAIIRDITERNRLEALIGKSEKLAIVGQLSAAVAHEIRNPLTTIKGFIQLMEKNQKYNSDYNKIVITELQRIESIIFEFLSLAKPHNEVSFSTVNIKEIVDQIVMLIATQAVLDDHQVISNIASGLPEIECEPNQIKQVLINLIQNSLESFVDVGIVHINVNRYDQNYICIQISDNGCGMSEHQLERIGEPFYSSKEKGTGLGLMTSFKIIENHKGKVKVKSEENKGTTVEIIIPIKQDTKSKSKNIIEFSNSNNTPITQHEQEKKEMVETALKYLNYTNIDLENVSHHTEKVWTVQFKTSKGKEVYVRINGKTNLVEAVFEK